MFSLTPITSPLPLYTGPHEVGILDLETEVQRRVLHDAILKETGEKAFEVCATFLPLVKNCVPILWLHSNSMSCFILEKSFYIH